MSWLPCAMSCSRRAASSPPSAIGWRRPGRGGGGRSGAPTEPTAERDRRARLERRVQELSAGRDELAAVRDELFAARDELTAERDRLAREVDELAERHDRLLPFEERASELSA